MWFAWCVRMRSRGDRTSSYHGHMHACAMRMRYMCMWCEPLFVYLYQDSFFSNTCQNGVDESVWIYSESHRSFQRVCSSTDSRPCTHFPSSRRRLLSSGGHVDTEGAGERKESGLHKVLLLAEEGARPEEAMRLYFSIRRHTNVRWLPRGHLA